MKNIRAKREPGSGSIVEQAKGVWYLRATLPGQRRQIRAVVHGSKAEAVVVLDELKIRAKTSVGQVDARFTVAQLCRAWMQMAKARVGSRTWMAYRAHVELYIIPSLDTRGALTPQELRSGAASKKGGRRVRDLKAHHVEGALTNWRLSGRNDREEGALSPRSVAHIFRTLRTICRWGMRSGLLIADPTVAIDPPRFRRREMRALDAHGIMTLLLAARGAELEMAIAVAVGTGLRRGELLGLRWSDVDLDTGRLTVRRSIEVVREESSDVQGQVRYVSREKQPKTPTGRRTISLATSIVAVLQRQRSAQRERRIQWGLGRDQDCFVFDRFNGSDWAPPRFSSEFAKLVRHAKLPHIRFHDLRHTFASTSMQAGVDLKTISASLGHSTVSVTADLYAHVHEVLQAEHAARIESVMGRALASAVGGPCIAAAKSRLSQKTEFRTKNVKKIRRILVAPTGIEPVFPP
jgi:integrase